MVWKCKLKPVGGRTREKEFRIYTLATSYYALGMSTSSGSGSHLASMLNLMIYDSNVLAIYCNQRSPKRYNAKQSALPQACA